MLRIRTFLLATVVLLAAGCDAPTTTAPAHPVFSSDSTATTDSTSTTTTTTTCDTCEDGGGYLGSGG